MSSCSASRASDAADTSDALSFDFCPSLCCGNSRNNIAAIYLDGGIEAAQRFIEEQFASLVVEAKRTGAEASFTDDWKSAFQEWSQANGRGLPRYRLASVEGPDHKKRFEVELSLGSEVVATASGRSKKEAEQAAAKAALSRFQ